jgi:Glycosyltransferases involved in cell wall biogenesis
MATTDKHNNEIPLVSIVVPIYNSASYLPRCLDSILKQTYTNWECILINDGSTDNSSEIAQNYVARDSRFSLYSQENRGLSAARNLGLDHAKGKWLACVDSDDELLPEYLAVLCETGEKNNADLVNGSRLCVYENGPKVPIIINDTVCYPKQAQLEYLHHDYLVTIVKLYRMEIIRKNNLRFNTDVRWAEDYIFTLEFNQHLQCYAACSQPNYLYHIRANDSSHLHRQFFSLQEELVLWNTLMLLCKRLLIKYPTLAKELPLSLGLDRFLDRLFKVIERQEKSVCQRYSLYRLIKLPIKLVYPISKAQEYRYWLLHRKQYFLLTLSRIWLNRK